MIFFYKQRVTCEKNYVCATVTIDADFLTGKCIIIIIIIVITCVRLNVLFIA